MTAAGVMAQNRARFISQLRSFFPSRTYFTEADYQSTIKLVKAAKARVPKTPFDLQQLQSFDVVTLGNEPRLVEPSTEGRDNFRFYLKIEELYDVLHETHLRLGHADQARMCEDLRQRFVNPCEGAVALYIKDCATCSGSSAQNQKKDFKPPERKKNWYRVDLIDMLKMPDGEYHYILVYQDCYSSFVHLRPMRSDRPAEIAGHLLNIFCKYGIPVAIYSNLGSIFTHLLLQELKARWSTLEIVDGKPLHREDRSGRRSDDYIRDMLLKWMEKERSTKWSQGIRYVQLMKNRAYHNTMRMSPYQATFGYDPKVGLTLTTGPMVSPKPMDSSPAPKATNSANSPLCGACHSHCSETRNCTICYGVVVYSCAKKFQGGMVVCDQCISCGINSIDPAVPLAEYSSQGPGTPRSNSPDEDESFFDPSSVLDLQLSVGNEEYTS